MGGARCRSGDAVEAREVRARAALENARRIAIAERRDEIALHLRLAGEKRLIDRGIVETRHRPGVEPERARRSEEHTSELQSLMRISYAVFCLKKKRNNEKTSEVEKYTIKLRTMPNKNTQ